MTTEAMAAAPLSTNGKATTEGDGGNGGKGEPTRRADDVGRYQYEDAGNVRRLRDMYGWALRYNHTENLWYLFDGNRFRPCHRNEQRELVKNIAAKLEEEALDTETPTATMQTMMKHAKHSRTANSIRSVLWLAETDPEMAITAEDLDRDPLKITVGNATIALHSYPFEYYTPSHKDLITMASPVALTPEAECPTWERFLQVTFEDTELIQFLQRSLGYCLTGQTHQQCFWLLHGTGRNGKSTFLDTIKFVLGDYATTTRFESLTYTKTAAGSSATPDLARLRGRRMVTASEGQENSRMDEALIKTLTGGEEITVRYLHANFFTYTPEYKIWLATNHLPRIIGNDLGIWRRVLRVPFTKVIEPQNVDPLLPKKLIAEAPGILNWMLHGWRMFLDSGGLSIPTSIAEATAEYKLTMDRLGDFIEEKLHVAEAARITNKRLFAAYTDWCKENNEPAWTMKYFSQQFEARGQETRQWLRRKISDERGWEGIGLKESYGPEAF